MKKWIAGLLAAIMMCSAFSGLPLIAATPKTSEDFRAVWVSSVLNLDFPSKKGLTVDQMKKEIQALIDSAVATGLNAIVLQVRPNADALYESALFPWSEYITGAQGVAPAGGFDPLEYWIERSHAAGLELHAWINPYRVTHTAHNRTDVTKLAAANPARKNPSWVITYQKALYFDPGLPETKKLVIDGVKEIITKYDVDGIHLDDYFYPGTDFADDASYAKYGNGLSKADWRRENVNDLVKGIQKVIQETKPSVRFGISPFAIWQNASSNKLGSDTRGAESYVTMYADTRRWVKEGWIDYICPQIYWLIGYNIADYQKVLSWWVDVCRGTGVDLYVGHAAYREAEQQTGWAGEIVRQLALNDTQYTNEVKGDIFFRAKNLVGALSQQIAAYYNASGGASSGSTGSTIVDPSSLRMTKLAVSQPSGNVSTSAKGYHIIGTCVPGIDLYMNGQLVNNRTAEGFFSVYLPIATGKNTFTFTQAGQTPVTRVITGTTATGGGGSSVATMNAAAISGVFPAKDEYIYTGNGITFRCTAPVGATVTARLNGKTYTLKDDNAARNASLDTAKIYATTYSLTQTLSTSATGGISNLGAPVYTMTYDGQTKTATGATVWLIQPNAAFHAGVTAESAWLYPNPTTDGGSAWQATKGQRDYVTAVSKDGTWVKLGSGFWIERENVSYGREPAAIRNVLTNGAYVKGSAVDMFKWTAKQYPVVHTSFDGSKVTIKFGLQTTVPPLALTDAEIAANTIFSSIEKGISGGVPYYVCTLKPGVRLEGVYTTFGSGSFQICFKKTKTLATGSKPLTGFSFVIDAGHGGSDTGALGPMGATLAEKHLNLINANKLAERLEKLGATVTRVRTADSYYTLYNRTEVSRLANPDMFISVHANSMSETTDARTIRGFSVWYRNELSKPLADTIIDNLYEVNPKTTRRQLSNQSNFYVCRPLWAPSVILETSFMCNITDFSWLVNEKEQDKMADEMVNAILKYYGK